MQLAHFVELLHHRSGWGWAFIDPDENDERRPDKTIYPSKEAAILTAAAVLGRRFRTAIETWKPCAEKFIGLKSDFQPPRNAGRRVIRSSKGLGD